MPKRCPKCKTLNAGSAVRCANPDCDHQFSPSSPAIPANPPAILPDPPVISPALPARLADAPVIPPPLPAIQQPPTAAAPAPAALPQPVTDLQAPIAQPDPEVTELRSLVDRLDKELTEQQQKLERFVNEQRALPPSAGPSPDSTAKTPELRDLIARTVTEAAQQGWRRLSAWRDKGRK